MSFVMRPELEAKMVALEEFETTIRKSDLFPEGWAFRDSYIGTGEVALPEIEREMMKYAGLKSGGYEGAAINYLLGMVETYGGKVLVSIASDTEYRLRVRYEEAELSQVLATLRDGLAAEDAGHGDPTMKRVRVAEYLFKIGVVEKKLKGIRGH